MFVSASNQTVAGPLPKHLQLAERFERDIHAGRLQPREKLLPERALAQELNVAVGTLRKALDELVERNLIERVQGSGNYIKAIDPADDSKAIYRLFHLELLGGGGLPTAETLSVHRRKAPKTRLDFQSFGDVFRIRRRRYLDGRFVAFEEVWLNQGLERPLKASDLSESLYHFYSSVLGIWMTRVDDSVSVSRLPDWAASLPGSGVYPWGFVERHSWANTGALTEFSRTWFDPEQARYVARWK